MKPSGIYIFQLQANAPYQLDVAGDYFKILSASGALNIRAEWGTLNGLIAGQGLEDSEFSRLQIQDASGAVNQVRIFIGDEKFVDGLGGTVNIAETVVPRSSAFANVQKTVTSASAQLLAANPQREYLLIQNKDLTGSVFLNFGAAAATVGNGIRIVPGGFYVLESVCTTQAMQCIGDIPNNPNIVVVEG